MTLRSRANDWPVRRQIFVCELLGTALLVFGGLSVVILMNGHGSPMLRLVPDERMRTALTAFLFGCIGGGIALSGIGRVSGAHINPAVTLAFWMYRKLDALAAVGYVLAQLIGAALGALPLLLWGAMGESVFFGATLPGAGYTTRTALLGELATTFGLGATLFVFLGFKPLRRYTPFTMPILYGVMVPLEAAVSGTSTNPARTFGPALISGRWDGWWIYWAGPFLGMLIAVIVFSALARRIEVAKLYHFGSDRRRLFHRMAAASR